MSDHTDHADHANRTAPSTTTTITASEIVRDWERARKQIIQAERDAAGRGGPPPAVPPVPAPSLPPVTDAPSAGAAAKLSDADAMALFPDAAGAIADAVANPRWRRAAVGADRVTVELANGWAVVVDDSGVSIWKNKYELDRAREQYCKPFLAADLTHGPGGVCGSVCPHCDREVPAGLLKHKLRQASQELLDEYYRRMKKGFGHPIPAR